jgi:hypothetical protein
MLKMIVIEGPSVWLIRTAGFLLAQSFGLPDWGNVDLVIFFIELYRETYTVS